ncbi:TPA: hypothetical protein IAA82_01675 [Candidatus Galligastranaerophilus gallistercoris]|nr:hypothetical protein [Candidatus Galligastranaerophilus gallistercoris]
MRIIQTVNDTIRLLFNPKTEVFTIGDFLLVRDCDENFLAQVVEVYDDKFDQEANVAKIKLIYRIVNGNEIVHYDNYTPSRECEVAKIRQKEIEKCINLNKKTITIGTSSRTKEKMELNTDFFDNNCVIFADKFEQTNRIFENLAPRLSTYKNVLILDFSGSCIVDNAKTFVAGENFRLPLSSDTIDYIRQKTLMRAKLETQVVLGDVFEEVKKFLITSDENYIPFNRFIKVIQSQCRQTPSVELLVLISWLKKYAQAGLFAKTKREFETFFKSLQKEKITKLDMSNIKTDWQKEIVEYIVNKINDNIFLFIRLNDNNINNDIINTLYLKKKNISFIPSFAYGYKKSSYVMEFAQNYILMPTLNPKRDFNHAAFQIQSLNKESYMLFGEDTKDFIFTLENETPVKKHKPDDDDEKDKVFISLNLQLEDMTSLELRPNNFEIKQAEPRKKRLREEISLSDVLSETNDTEEEVSENGEETVSYSQVLNSENIGEMPDLPDENLNEIQTGENNEDFIMEDELDYFEPSKETEASVSENEPIDNNETETGENIEEISPEIEKEENKTIEREADEILNKTDEKEQQESIAEYSEDKAPIEPEVVDEVFKEDIEEISNKPVVEAEISEDEILDKTPENKMPEIKQTDSNVDSAVKIKEDDAINVVGGELIEFAKTQENIYPVEIEEEAEKINEELIDEDILDAIDEENGKNSPAAGIEETKDTVSTIIDEVVQEKIEDKLKSDETVNKLDKLNNESLNEASLIDEAEQKANDEIEAKFEAIMNEAKEEGALNSSLQINENVSIDLEKIKKDIKTPEKKLPVFDDEKEETENIPSVGFKEGEKVSHEKYGTGTILKVIKYSNRCLLQIEFPEIGKRLLDPKIAKLQIAEEV